MTSDAFVLMIYLTGTAYLDAAPPKPIAVFASEKQEGEIGKTLIDDEAAKHPDGPRAIFNCVRVDDWTRQQLR